MDLVFAYIDPGSGSLVIQALIAGLVAIPVIFRQRIASFVRMVRGDRQPEAESAIQDDQVNNG
jgi:hypothetical protein